MVVPDERDAAAPTDVALADGARAIAKVGVVGSGTMATGIIEVFAKAGYEVVSVTRGAEKSAEVCEAVTTLAGQGRRCAASSTEADRDAAAGPDQLVGTTLDHLADVDLVVEAVVEEVERQEGAVRQPRRDLQAGRRCSPPPPRRCR